MIAAAALVLAFAAPPEFEYEPPGALLPDSGTGLNEPKVFAPGMRYPIEDSPSYANSQVYMHGGYLGPGGGQCDAPNYSYPWRDNYCESRSWDMPLCPAGQGHQGQDIRPGTCTIDQHWMSNAADGTVTNIGSYSVYVTAADGTRFDFLHGSQIAVSNGQQLAREERIGKVSNKFNNTPTTIHLHFNIKQDVGGVGFVFVSPYMSLVKAYEELLGISPNPPQGSLDGADCTAIRGWAQDVDAPEQAIEIALYFDGEAGDPNAVGVQVLANEYRDDLCDALGSCEHAFTVAIPRSLKDSTAHPVFAYGVDAMGEGEDVALDLSPQAFTCDPPAIPTGVRRAIASPEVIAAWAFSPFWDAATVDTATFEAIEAWDPVESTVELVRLDGGADVYLIDAGFRRLIPDEDVAARWRFQLGEAEVWTQAELDALPEGTDVRSEPFLITDGSQTALIDDPQCEEGDTDPLCDLVGEDEGSEEAEGTGGDDGGISGGGIPASLGDEAGCGCTASGRGGTAPWFLLFAAGFLVRRRRD